MQHFKKKMWKRLSAIMLVLITIVQIGVPRGVVFAAEQVTDEIPTSGQCGESLYWELNENGVLFITGEGEMENYNEPGKYIGANNFSPWFGRSDITKVIIRDKVTSIGSWAFCYCDNLTSVEISKSVTHIGDFAFTYSDSLTNISVAEGNQVYDSRDNCNGIIETATNTLVYGCANTIIPSSVTGIGAYAFYFCENLTSVEIPSNVMSIGESAFEYCTSLSSIDIPKNVKSIGNRAFYRAEALTSITVAEGNSVYDSRNNCNAIIEKATDKLILGCSNTVIPDGMTGLGAFAFGGCENLTEIEIPESVISIGESAFEGCGELNDIILSENVNYIGKNAFDGCATLESFVIPSGITVIEDGVFGSCYSLSNIEIPMGITSVGNDAFAACSNLTQIEIPSSVASIGDRVFSGCFKLSSIEIPMGVTSIGKETFLDCGQLTSVDLPSSVTSIGEGAFAYCSDLIIVEIPINVTEIGDYAFYYCGALETISIPSGVTSIGEKAFKKCSSLTSIHVAEDNSVYDSRENCNGIIETKTNEFIQGCSSSKIPSSVTSIGDGAFYGCDKLNEITIPEGVISIGDEAFCQCINMIKVEIPPSVTNIGHFAFESCESMESVEIPDGVTSIGLYAFSDCDSLINVQFPRSVKEIWPFAFSHCNKLTNVTINYRKLNLVGYDIFYNSLNVTLIAFPGSTTEVYALENEIPFIALEEIYDVNEIINQIESTESGTTLEVDLQDITLLEQEILEALQEKDITLVVPAEDGATYSINGADIPDGEVNDIDLSVVKTSKENGNISAETITALAGNREAEQLVFNENGSFGFDAELTIPMTSGIEAEKAVLLQQTQAGLVYQDSSLVEGGIAALSVEETANRTITFGLEQKSDSVIVYGTNGDINADGAVSIKDTLQLLHQISNRASLNEVEKGFADVDLNNSVNIQDLMRELHYVSGRSESLYEVN